MVTWTAKQDADLRKWFGAGMSAGQIAGVMKISRDAIIGRKFRLGLCNPARAGRPFSENEIARFVALRKSGVPYRKIAKSLRRNWHTLAKRASRMGITRSYARGEA